MKKVKITVLEKTLNKKLAERYGVEGLGACPMLREGQVFYADYAKPRRGRLYINTYSLWRTARKAFITEIGYASRARRYAAAMTDCVR